MKRFISLFLLGACALITACSSERLIAPFYGLGPFLESSSIAIALAGLAAGFTWATWRPPASHPGIALVLLGAWTMLAPWLRTPLLRSMESVGLPLATLTALVLWVGLPMAALAGAIASVAGDTIPAPDSPRSSRAESHLHCWVPPWPHR